MICNQNYESICALPTKSLLQANVDASVARKLDALARARGQSRASYLRHLVEMHVRAVTPKILKAIDRTIPVKAKGVQ